MLQCIIGNNRVNTHESLENFRQKVHLNSAITMTQIYLNLVPIIIQIQRKFTPQEINAGATYIVYYKHPLGGATYNMIH